MMKHPTHVTIKNPFGTFRWVLDFPGSARDAARAIFEAAEQECPLPDSSDDPILGRAVKPSCPKCGGEPCAEWYPQGTHKPVVKGEPIALNGHATLVGYQGASYVTKRECLRWDCDCGYSWLGPVVSEGVEVRR